MDRSIEFHEVSYRLGQHDLVKQLSLQVQSGDTLMLLGRSGCGKTTILKLINGLLKPTSGQVCVGGQSTAQWDLIHLRRQIGYVIQEVGLFPHFTVTQNVGLVPSLLGWTPGQIQSRVYELLELVGLPPAQFAKRYPHQLSGGQRQRIGVARALAADPPFLLMDEPFGALDSISRVDLQQEFLRIQQYLGKTIVFVTHDVQEALLLGTKIGLVQAGKLLSFTSPQEFLASPSPEIQAFLQGFHQVAQVYRRLGQDRSGDE
ncbi:MAG TPA: ATP-binding cassette domain-containing protein [Stenomitos sp.]